MQLSKLQTAGLDRVNISLDTLDANKFTLITRRNGNRICSSGWGVQTLCRTFRLEERDEQHQRGTCTGF